MLASVRPAESLPLRATAPGSAGETYAVPATGEEPETGDENGAGRKPQSAKAWEAEMEVQNGLRPKNLPDSTEDSSFLVAAPPTTRNQAARNSAYVSLSLWAWMLSVLVLYIGLGPLDLALRGAVPVPEEETITNQVLDRFSSGTQWSYILWGTFASMLVQLIAIVNVATLLGWEAVRFLVPANIAVIIVASPLFDIGTFVAGTYNSLSRQRLALVTQIGLVIGNGWAARSKQRQREAEAAGRGSPPWYRCDAEFGKQVLALTLPQLMSGFCVVVFQLVLFPIYLKLDTTAQSAFTIFVNPLATVVLNMVGRACLYQVLIHNPLRTWILTFQLLAFMALASRIMVSGLSSLGAQLVTSAVSGIIEIISRATVVNRDRVMQLVLKCRKSPQNYFREPKRTLYISDAIISAMFAEYQAICASTLLILCTRIYFLNATLASAFPDFIASLAIQLVIALIVDLTSVAVEERLGFPLSANWRKRWSTGTSWQSWGYCFFFSGAGFLYVIPIATDVLKHQLAN